MTWKPSYSGLAYTRTASQPVAHLSGARSS
jgi:hypothetical protein